jgi:hypothetical protein
LTRPTRDLAWRVYGKVIMRNTFVRMILAADAIGLATLLAGIIAVMFAGERMLLAEDD